MGLLGAGLFRRFEMIIDYEKEVIHLYRFGKKEKRASYHPILQDKTKFVVHPIASLYGKMVTEVLVGKNRLSFILDTGAETNVLDSRLPKQVLANVTMERRISVVGAGSERKEAWYGSLKHLSVGGTRVNHLDVMVTSLQHLSDAYGRSIDGILGYSFLSGKIAAINFANNELYVWK
jgi:predicted aspartyl protease